MKRRWWRAGEPRSLTALARKKERNQTNVHVQKTAQGPFTWAKAKKRDEQITKQPVSMAPGNRSRQGVEKGSDSVADEAAANLAGRWTWCQTCRHRRFSPGWLLRCSHLLFAALVASLVAMGTSQRTPVHEQRCYIKMTIAMEMEKRWRQQRGVCAHHRLWPHSNSFVGPFVLFHISITWCSVLHLCALHPPPIMSQTPSVISSTLDYLLNSNISLKDWQQTKCHLSLCLLGSRVSPWSRFHGNKQQL